MKNQTTNQTGVKFLLIAFVLTALFLVLSITTYGQTQDEKIADYKSKITVAEQGINDLETKLETATDKKEKKKLKKEISNKKKEVEEYKEQIANLEENKYFDEDINIEDTTEIRIGKRKVLIIGEKSKMEESIEKLEDGIVEFNQNINLHKRSIEELNDSIDIAEAKIKVTKSEEEIELLENEIEQYEKQIERHETIVESFDDGVMDIEDELAELEEDLIELGEDLEDFDFDFDDIKDYSRKKKFKGHWAGLEFGFSNYLNSNYQLALPTGGEFMELNPEKSWSFSLNPLQQSIAFSHYIGLVTGAGFEWSYYNLKQNVDLSSPNGIITSTEVTDKTYSKNVLQTAYFNVPLLLEFQIPTKKDKNRVSLAFGIIGSVKLLDRFKKVYEDDGNRQKYKIREDYHVAPYKYSLTARLGYKGYQLYVNYDMVSLFQSNQGPELYFKAFLKF